MKKPYFILVCLAAIQLIAIAACNAQSNTLALKLPPSAVVIDGNSQEWGDSLSYYNPESKINYTLANDKNNLYLVVKTNNLALQNNILSSGLTLTIDPKGKKRSSYTVTFPAAEQGSSGPTTLQQNTLRARYSNIRKIAVDGFKDIEENEIPSSNSYGIQIAIGYDDKGNLVYEEAIPLELFHAGDLAKNEWSFNIKLNGVESRGGREIMSGVTSEVTPGPPTNIRGGSGGRGGGSSLKKTDFGYNSNLAGGSVSQPIDFWGRFSLSK